MCFLAVSTIECNSRNASAPKSERNVQEFFNLIFNLRIPRSLPLLLDGIVAGILLGLLVFRQTFCQHGDCLVLLAYLTIQGFYVTVKFGNFSILLIDGFTHQPHLSCHILQHFRYVRNLLFPILKGTENISYMQEIWILYFDFLQVIYEYFKTDSNMLCYR